MQQVKGLSKAKLPVELPFPEALRIYARLLGAVFLVVLANAFVFVVASYINALTPNHSFWIFALLVVGFITVLIGWRIITRGTAFQVVRPSVAERRILIVGVDEAGQLLGRVLQKYESMGLNLAGYLKDASSDNNVIAPSAPILGRVEDIRKVVVESDINDVIITLSQRDYTQIDELALTLHDLPVQVRVVPDRFERAPYRALIENLGFPGITGLSEPMLTGVQRSVKRTFDLVVSATLIIISFFPMLIIALLIKLDSSGPVLFGQPRVGENGRLFTMYKFRSTIMSAAQMVGEVTGLMEAEAPFKKVSDPRVTRVGQFLRHTALDELPQLFNVLKGDMSLVGPRPELPMFVGQYESWQYERFAVPQGITGWWKISGRADKPLQLHVEEDLYYIRNYSLWLDIYILLKASWVTIRGKGAY